MGVESEPNKRAAYRRFQSLTKRLLRVSKADIDEKRREYEEAKGKGDKANESVDGKEGVQ